MKTKMKNPKMNIGIEVEAIYNREIVGTIRSGLHWRGELFSTNNVQFIEPTDGERLFDALTNVFHKKVNWTVERDSSLQILERKYALSDTVEMISKVAKNKKEFIERLYELKELLIGNKDLELEKVMYFNKTCGCHIHFSFDDVNLKKICGFAPLRKVRESFFRGLNDLDIRESLKKEIRKHYFRKYAMRTSKNLWKNDIQNMGRNCEFNFHSLGNNKGFEWRAFNLKGVKTWNEFFKLLELGYDCASRLRDYIKKFSDSQDEKFDKDIKKIKEKAEEKSKQEVKALFGIKPMSIYELYINKGPRTCINSFRMKKGNEINLQQLASAKWEREMHEQMYNSLVRDEGTVGNWTVTASTIPEPEENEEVSMEAIMQRRVNNLIRIGRTGRILTSGDEIELSDVETEPPTTVREDEQI